MDTLAKHYRNIMCPVDFDANSPTALAFAGKIAQETGARICLLHVVPWTVATVPIDASEVLAELKQSATLRLQRLAEETLHARIPVEVVVTVARDHGRRDCSHRRRVRRPMSSSWRLTGARA